eukprot:1154560-Pelagomonas_calceolata.AAC.7
MNAPFMGAARFLMGTSRQLPLLPDLLPCHALYIQPWSPSDKAQELCALPAQCHCRIGLVSLPKQHHAPPIMPHLGLHMLRPYRALRKATFVHADAP